MLTTIIIYLILAYALGLMVTHSGQQYESNKLDANTHMLVCEAILCIVEETDIAYRQKTRDLYQNVLTKEFVMVDRYPLLEGGTKTWKAKQTIQYGIREFPFNNVNDFKSWILYRMPSHIKHMVK